MDLSQPHLLTETCCAVHLNVAAYGGGAQLQTSVSIATLRACSGGYQME